MSNNRNCGLCGEKTCNEFNLKVKQGMMNKNQCPFDSENTIVNNRSGDKEFSSFETTDSLGNVFDFLLRPVGSEISTRKIIRPFRTDLIEKFSIKKGDYIQGRPVGAGCPVTHVLKVYDIDYLSGILSTWAVGPGITRRGNQKVHDISAYSMVAFEGIAENIVVAPQIGKVAYFLPSFCMIRFTHYGLINEIAQTREGTFVRAEDIHIGCRPN